LIFYQKKAMFLCLIKTKALQQQFVQSFRKAVLYTVVSILLIMFKQTLELSVGLFFGDVLRRKIRRISGFV
jgi:hypothetical protein